MIEMVLLNESNSHATSEWHIIELKSDVDAETYCGILFEWGKDIDRQEWDSDQWHWCSECKRLYDKAQQ